MRAAAPPLTDAGGALADGEDDGDEAGEAERDELRRERKRERERERRLENRDGKRSKMTRDAERDISERIALGQAVPTASTETLFDARLFNQEGGVNNSLVGPNCTPDVMLHNHSHTHSAAELCSEALGGRKFFGSRFAPPSASTIQRYYVEEQTGWRSARLRPGDVVFDLGPHNGFFTMKAAKRVGPAGIVVAVEASRTNYEQIQKMIECNGLRNVRLVYGAVYSVDGEELRLRSQFNYDKRGEVSVGNTVHPDWTRKDGSHPAGLVGQPPRPALSADPHPELRLSLKACGARNSDAQAEPDGLGSRSSGLADGRAEPGGR